MKPWKNPTLNKAHTLSHKFFILVLITSLVALFVSTLVYYHHGYRTGINRIQQNVQFINESYLPSVAASLYAFDETQLQLLLKSMLKLEGIARCELTEELSSRKLKLSEGFGPAKEQKPHVFPVIYHHQNGAATAIGTLFVYPDYTAVSKQQWNYVAVNAIPTIILVTISALVVMLLFQKLVARHLNRMAEFCSKIDSAHLDTKLQLDRRRRQDELEQVVTAVNALQERVHEDIEQREATERLLRESEQRYRSLNDNIPVGVFRISYDGEPVSTNPALRQMLSIAEAADIKSMRIGTFFYQQGDWKRLIAEVERVGQVQEFECQLRSRHDKLFWASISARATKDHTEGAGYIDGVVADIQARKLSEEKERENLAFRKRVFESSVIPIVIMDIETYTFIECNPAAASVYGYPTVEETLGKTPMDVSTPTQYDGTPSAEKAKYYVHKVVAEGAQEFEWRHQRPNKEIWDAIVHVITFRANERQLIQLTLQDITQHKAAEEARERLQSQLHQAQKMEAVGHLAGGIAHDFNNMLSVVTGNTELALMQSKDFANENLNKRLKSIYDAVTRSAGLVRQLLAFARKQTINPTVLDINGTITGMLKVLRRLIGEDIELAWMPGPEIDKIKIDPSQIDQILANLMVNARDAIGGVGKVTIETKNVTVDADGCLDSADGKAGRYVMLSVSDTGCGMSDETLARIFEPFFTTKEIGRGTGLGLATVYGVAKQNNGFVRVDSKLGQGATFQIYFPAVDAQVRAIETGHGSETPPQGSETVLIVEDDANILELAEMILEQLGYTILSAGTTKDAIDIASSHGGKIDLLLTDVIMPKMNGRELAERIGHIHPGIICLYMSGYTADIIAHHGKLEEGVHFVSKPFSIIDLAVKVRQALGG
ncbi:MAG: response regulator [Desulfobacterales bacterium]|nr:response regulator [Desulfobacterales bacterium]